MFEVEWEESYLGDISMFLSHANYTYSDLNSAGKIGYLHYGFIHSSEYQKLNVAKLPKISKDQAKNYDCLKDGDIVVADVSEDKDGIGKYVSVDNCEQHPVISGLHTIAIRPDQKYINPVFSPYLLSQSNIHVNLCAKAVGTKVYSISKDNLASLKIKIPSLDEQAAIASALSDMDSLISSLERLIAKKCLIKQGAMRELLTGKKRLPGFEGEWKTLLLKKCLHVNHGKNQINVESKNGIYPILGSGGILGFSIKALADGPSVLIGRKGTIDKPQYIETPFWTIDTLFYTDFNICHYPKFFYYIFCTIDWHKINAASGVPSLRAGDIEEIEVNVPCAKEQAAIASVLSDMDDEIAALEAKLEKNRKIRSGMMEELLTGRIRLV